MKRSRGRNRRSGGNAASNNHNNPNRHYESVGPDVKIRGSAQQVLEKYQQYARDAQTSGDRVLSEAYFQFAEHYQRIVAKQLEAKERQQQPRGGRDDRDNRRDDRDNRNESSDEQSSDDQTQDTRSGSQSRSQRDGESRDEQSGGDKPDSLKVIDAGEEAANADTVEQSPEPAGKPEGERPKTRRKPYRSREATSDEPEAVTEGVMKTLSRGRKKAAAAEEKVSAEDTSAETTD